MTTNKKSEAITATDAPAIAQRALTVLIDLCDELDPKLRRDAATQVLEHLRWCHSYEVDPVLSAKCPGDVDLGSVVPGSEIRAEDLKTLDQDELEQAIKMADKLRTDHNGIMAVYVYLGHDGDNVCWFNDSHEDTGRGCSSQSLLEAIDRAQSDWRFRRLVSRSTHHYRETVDNVLELCVARFNGNIDDRAESGVFNTATFQTLINQDAYAVIGEVQAEELLRAHPRVVPLFGGCHWYMMPDGAEKATTVAQ